MVGIETLKKVDFLKAFPDPILEKMGSLVREIGVDKDTVLIQQGDRQEVVYILLEGRVVLNCKALDGQLIALNELAPGSACGVTALLGEDASNATFTAVCTEPCRILTLAAPEVLNYFDSDHQTGYLVMRRVVDVFQTRRNNHTQQFLHSLAIHPDLEFTGNGEALS